MNVIATPILQVTNPGFREKKCLSHLCLNINLRFKLRPLLIPGLMSGREIQL